MEGLPLQPAVQRFMDLDSEMDTQALLEATGIDMDREIHAMLIEKYSERFGDRADSIIRLSPDVHAVFGGSIFDAERQATSKEKHANIVDLDVVIAEVSRDVDDEVRRRLVAARLL